MMIFEQTIEARTKRFMKHIEKRPNGCWMWIGATESDGRYGVVAHNKKIKRSHRVSWELHRGKIPKGLYVCHKCDVTLCVNPKHLFVGTQLDNMRDCSRKGRTRKTPQLGEAHGRHKLSQSDVDYIKHIVANTNLFRREIGTIFGVCSGTIGHIANGKTWVKGSSPMAAAHATNQKND